MIGVATYPYTVLQNLYREEFETLVASTITHPYISMTTFNQGSAPHNILTGSNFSSGAADWTSETQRSFVPKSYTESFNAKAFGLRSEELLFVG